jgi:Ca2+-binding EF-hand superfamily protein
LRNYLNKNNIEFEEQCLRRFIHNFDKDEDFSIDYKEFLGIISPKKDDKLQIDIISKEPQENENNEIDSSSEKIFQEIIINEFNLIKDLYKIADELKNQKDFTTYETFLEIVKDEKYITKENLGVFLEDNNVELDDNDLDVLLYRIDADNDGQISYQEFLEIFFPYRENYITKDIKPEKERNKNYTIDDIKFKDENDEIQSLNEE